LVNWGSSPISTFDYLLDDAIGRGLKERVILLLHHGASAGGRTYYERAVRDGQTEIAELLVRHGAVPVALSLSPAQELRAACLSGDVAAVRRIVAARPESMQDAAALIGAAQQGRLEIVRLLLDLGFAVDALGQGGETALHQAANAGHLPVVREFVERGASLAIREQTHGGTPLGWAEYCCDARGLELM
jgi:ankyrin repeat protein